MFFVLIVIAVILCGVVLYLPYMSGLTKIEKSGGNSKKSKTSTSTQSHRQSSDDYNSGYVPPDEDYDFKGDDSGFRAKASALKERVNATANDLPIRIKLQNQQLGAHIRNRKEKLDLDTDPNKYDYDLDELIEKESRLAGARQQADFYKNEVLGKEKEEMV